jgi:uncharacterized membrane protein HdeD (DUF308 family)
MRKTSQATMTPSRRAHDLVDHLTNSLLSKSRCRWLLLIAGVTRIVIGLAISSFAYATVATLAILTGVFCLVAAGLADMLPREVSVTRTWRIPQYTMRGRFGGST